MAKQATSTPPAIEYSPFGKIVATNISAAEYMTRYAESRHEWVRGVVIKMSPVSMRHHQIVVYLNVLLNTYFELNPMGQVLGEPFVMRVDATHSHREPDLQVILDDNPGELTETAMIGAADICIEVVSPESSARDYGEKFAEYEEGGVREYWIIDPLRQECHFYHLQAAGRYARALPDKDHNYHTPILPKLALHVSTLWQEKLPKPLAIGQVVQAMITNNA